MALYHFSVRHVSRGKGQMVVALAYSFDIALQNEFTLEENIRLAKEFCQEQFVARGMIVDLAVHTESAFRQEK